MTDNPLFSDNGYRCPVSEKTAFTSQLRLAGVRVGDAKWEH